MFDILIFSVGINIALFAKETNKEKIPPFIIMEYSTHIIHKFNVILP